ncbi:MAG: hypothetical protein JWQ68_406 [Cryobacterium sp.]|jgi:hypothetical protein|nr:hypothetical protein [Cryobacterium sp.]
MYGVTHEAQALADVGTLELSPAEWRVTDSAFPVGDPFGLLGFIRQVGDAFEVMKLGHPLERTYYFSFERARASFVTAGPQVVAGLQVAAAAGMPEHGTFGLQVPLTGVAA